MTSMIILPSGFVQKFKCFPSNCSTPSGGFAILFGSDSMHPETQITKICQHRPLGSTNSGNNERQLKIENSREKNSWPTRDNNRISPILQLQCSIDQPDYKGRSSLTLRTAAGDEVGDTACPRQK